MAIVFEEQTALPFRFGIGVLEVDIHTFDWTINIRDGSRSDGRCLVSLRGVAQLQQPQLSVMKCKDDQEKQKPVFNSPNDFPEVVCSRCTMVKEFPNIYIQD